MTFILLINVKMLTIVEKQFKVLGEASTCDFTDNFHIAAGYGERPGHSQTARPASSFKTWSPHVSAITVSFQIKRLETKVLKPLRGYGTICKRVKVRSFHSAKGNKGCTIRN